MINRSVIAAGTVLTLVAGACSGGDDDGDGVTGRRHLGARGITGTVTVNGQTVTVTTTITVDREILPGSRTVTGSSTANPAKASRPASTDHPEAGPAGTAARMGA